MVGGMRTTRLVVAHPGALGDTLLALPALAALKRRYEPATLDLIGHPSLVDILPGRSVVDHMRSIDGPEFHSLFEDNLTRRSDVKAFFGSVDVAVVWFTDPSGQVKNTLTAFRVAHVIVQSPSVHAGRGRHATERFADTLAGVHIPECPRTPFLAPTDEDLQRGLVWLAQAGLNPKEVPVVAVHPGSGSSVKCWPAECFAEPVTGLCETGAAVIVIEGPADAEAVGSLMRVVGSRELPRLAGVGLRTIVGVLSQCRAFFGNDSGLLHLAAGLGIQTLGIFGPTDPAVWAPRGDHVITFRGESGCRCVTREEQRACFDRPCLAVPPKSVSKSVCRALHEPSASLAT